MEKQPRNSIREQTSFGQKLAPVKERVLPDWLEGFMQYTKDTASPELYRRWGGLACVSAALERKVWLYVPRVLSDLFPGMYVVMAGPPATGKTVITAIAQELWDRLPDHHVAPTSVSRASLMDALYKANRSYMDNGKLVTFNSIFVIANEMGSFIPTWDSEFMNTLTDIWNGRRYGEKKRGKDLDYTMPRPQINMLCGTTPSYLTELMPTGAWDQGFISRTMLIYSAEPVVKGLFQEVKKDRQLFEDMALDLQHIAKLHGEMFFEPDAARAIAKWDEMRGPPTPEHPKLANYIGRRTEHLLKLCMIASVSRSDSLRITMDDYQSALSWLLDAEDNMPNVFKSMAIGGDARAVEDTWYFAYQVFAKEKQSIPEHKLIEFLSNRVPAHSVERILQVMVKGGLLSKDLEGYRPKARVKPF